MYDRPRLERLETRECAATTTLSGGVLTVTGTNGPDVLRVGPTPAGVSSVVIRGLGGNDVLDAAMTSVPCRLEGGAGNDWLRGGAASDWLEAGSAAEHANGGPGLDWNAHVWAVAGAAPSDIVQGAAPSCSFLAALGEVAERVNLASRVRYLGGRQYGVWLFYEGYGWYEQRISFNGVLSGYDPRPQAEGESWVILFQRAYGTQATWPSQALLALTGQPVSFAYPSSFTALEWAVRNGRNVVAATSYYADHPALVANHAYGVVSVSATSVTLRNPWGGLVTVSRADFAHHCQGFWYN